METKYRIGQIIPSANPNVLRACTEAAGLCCFSSGSPTCLVQGDRPVIILGFPECSRWPRDKDTTVIAKVALLYSRGHHENGDPNENRFEVRHCGGRRVRRSFVDARQVLSATVPCVEKASHDSPHQGYARVEEVEKVCAWLDAMNPCWRDVMSGDGALLTRL